MSTNVIIFVVGSNAWQTWLLRFQFAVLDTPGAVFLLIQSQTRRQFNYCFYSSSWQDIGIRTHLSLTKPSLSIMAVLPDTTVTNAIFSLGLSVMLLSFQSHLQLFLLDLLSLVDLSAVVDSPVSD